MCKIEVGKTYQFYLNRGQPSFLEKWYCNRGVHVFFHSTCGPVGPLCVRRKFNISGNITFTGKVKKIEEDIGSIDIILCEDSLKLVD